MPEGSAKDRCEGGAEAVHERTSKGRCEVAAQSGHEGEPASAPQASPEAATTFVVRFCASGQDKNKIRMCGGTCSGRMELVLNDPMFSHHCVSCCTREMQWIWLAALRGKHCVAML